MDAVFKAGTALEIELSSDACKVPVAVTSDADEMKAATLDTFISLSYVYGADTVEVIVVSCAEAVVAMLYCQQKHY